MNAREFTLHLRGRWHGTYGCTACPVCQPERRRDQNALTLADGKAGLLLNCKKSGCDFRVILAAGGMEPGHYRSPDLREIQLRREQDSIAAKRRSEVAQRIWAEAVPIEGTLAATYLRSRGIRCALPDSLRFHPNCFHGPTQTALPAMVALVTGGEGFAVHRTFLRPDGTGKAGLPGGDKLMLGRTFGGAVRLSDGPGRYVITEGIETGLSLLSGLVDGPMIVGAALSASGMRALSPPSGPGQIAIACDGDLAGRDAAKYLAGKAHALGWRVSILDPGEGRDFNDILKEQAVAA